MKTIHFPPNKSPSKPLDVPVSQQQAKATKELDALVSRSQDILFRAKTVFPFDFFPDEIVVYKDRIEIAYGTFIISKEIFPLKYDNIESVIVSYSIFFATIEFKVTGFADHPEKISFFKINDALKLKRIILGLITTRKENVDVSNIPVTELSRKLEEIGSAEER